MPRAPCRVSDSYWQQHLRDIQQSVGDYLAIGVNVTHVDSFEWGFNLILLAVARSVSDSDTEIKPDRFAGRLAADRSTDCRADVSGTLTTNRISNRATNHSPALL